MYMSGTDGGYVMIRKRFISNSPKLQRSSKPKSYRQYDNQKKAACNEYPSTWVELDLVSWRANSSSKSCCLRLLKERNEPSLVTSSCLRAHNFMRNDVGFLYLKGIVVRKVGHAISLETAPLLLIDSATVLDVEMKSVPTVRLRRKCDASMISEKRRRLSFIGNCSFAKP